MKTLITSLVTVLLVLQSGHATIAGGITLTPVTRQNLMTDSDSVGSGTNVVGLPVPDEEPSVDDIPFDTQKVSAGYFAAMLPSVAPEETVNDIPFETDAVASRYLPLEFLGIFTRPEAYVEDIPFCTQRIAGRYLNRECTKYCYRAL